MNKLLFCLSFILISASGWAESLTLTPNSVVRLTVSNREPNVITVMNDRIVEANSAAGKLADKKATDSGALIFTTEETVPFSLYIETEKGFGFTVNAIQWHSVNILLGHQTNSIAFVVSSTFWDNVFQALHGEPTF